MTAEELRYLKQGVLLVFGDGTPYCRKRYHVIFMWKCVPPPSYWVAL